MYTLHTMKKVMLSMNKRRVVEVIRPQKSSEYSFSVQGRKSNDTEKE